MRTRVLVVALAAVSLAAAAITAPASATTSDVVPLTDGVGALPLQYRVAGVTADDVIVDPQAPRWWTPSTALAVSRATGKVRSLDLPVGGIAVAGDTVLSFDPSYDANGRYTWLDLGTGATGTGVQPVYTEVYTEAGALRLTRPVDPGPFHLIRRDVQTSADTDLGQVPDAISGYSAGILAGGGHVVVYDTQLRKAAVLTSGTFSTVDLPSGLASCTSVTTNAVGCWSYGSVVRVPLDGGAPVVVTSSTVGGTVVVTPTRTVWFDYADAGLSMQPAAGGAITRTSKDVNGPGVSSGSDVITILVGGLGQAGLGVLTDGSKEVSMLAVAPAGPLVASSLLQSTGRVLWLDGFDTPYRFRSARVSDGTLLLGTTGKTPQRGDLAGISGDTVLGSVPVSGGVPKRPEVDLYRGTVTSDGFVARAVAGTSQLSGDRVVYGLPGSTGPLRLAVYDLATDRSTSLPYLGTDPDWIRYAFWGDAIAYVKPDNSVWWRSLSTGTTVQVAPQYSAVGTVQMWGDVVAWQTVGGTSDPDQWSWADIHDLASVSTGRLVKLTNDGALVSTSVNSNEYGPLELRPYDGSPSIPVTDMAFLTAGASADGPVAAWVDPDDHQPRGRVLDLVGGRPRALSPLSAPVVPDGTAGVTIRVPTSTRLSDCRVVLRNGAGDAVRTETCNPAAMELGVATATVTNFYPMGGYPAGAYTWTLEAGNAAGPLLGLDGKPRTFSGTVYSPTDTTITKYVTPITVLAGKQFTLTAAAIAIPAPKAQWYRSRVKYTWGSPIPGATSPSYTTTATTDMNGNVFHVEFDNGWLGAGTGAVVTVVWAPKVTASPRSVTAARDTYVTFTAKATANPAPTVSWQYSKDRGATWLTWTGTTTSIKVKATTAKNLWRFRAVFANTYGKATTSAAVLRVS